MKNDKECKANNEAGHQATPKPPPVTPRLCLIVLGHKAILLPVCRRAMGNAEKVGNRKKDPDCWLLN
jgi:hypothetical protein